MGTRRHGRRIERRADQHTDWSATVRLASVVSSVGVAVAVAVDQVGILSDQLVVFGVIGVGFATSWVRSGRRSLGRAV